MLLFIRFVWTWILAHPFQVVGYLLTLSSLATALTPKRYQAARAYGWLVRAHAFLSFLTHVDEPGTLTWPVLGRTAVSALLQPAADPSKPKGAPAVPPLPLLLGLALGLAAPLLLGCSGAQHPARTLEQDARIAINAGGHLVQLTDTGLAAAYQVDAADAGAARLDALERAYAPALHAIDVARASLLAADAARATYEAARDAPSGCALGRALAHASSDVVAAAGLANAVHAGSVPDATRDTVGGLASAAQMFTRQCPAALTDGGAE